MPLQTDTPAELITKYPLPPPQMLNGKPNSLYLQWAEGLAALHIAASLKVISDRWLNTSKG
jgi:hypothetical protein